MFLNMSLLATDFTKQYAVRGFINQMVKKQHLNKKELQKLFKHVKVQYRALSIVNPSCKVGSKKTCPPTPAQRARWIRKRDKYKTGTWTRYAGNLLTNSKVEQGIAFVKKHRGVFQKVYNTYGVPPEYITAIIGVETAYGKKMGTYPIFDTLATLAFKKNRRNRFYKQELRAFLHMTHRQKLNPRVFKGSYAGAMGLGQFMPSAYDAYGVDFNKDGKANMLYVYDSIASIGNYLQKNGWRKWEPVAERVKFKGKRYTKRRTGYKIKYPQSKLKELKLMYGKWSFKGPVRLIKLDRYNYDELWYGAFNFYVITRYNHNNYYAMTVHQLARRIRRGYKKKYGVDLR